MTKTKPPATPAHTRLCIHLGPRLTRPKGWEPWEVWEAYLDICTARGTSASAEITKHILRTVKKGKKGKR